MKIYQLEQIASTNEYLIHLVRSGKFSESVAIWTDNQTGGKGRNGNNWLTHRGKDLALSIYIPQIRLAVSKSYILNICAALGVTRSLSEFIEDVKIKWPNDIMIGNRKVGGILINNVLQKAEVKDTVMGIGVNVNSMDLDRNLPHATSMIRVGCDQVDISLLAEKIINNTIHLIEALKDEEFLMDEFNSQLWKKNEFLVFKHFDREFDARVHRVDCRGNLYLEVEGVLKPFPQDELKTIIPDF